MGLFSLDDTTSEDVVCTPQGEYVTSKRVGKIESVLKDGENVHYLTRGSTVDVQKGGDSSSLFGDNRSRKTGTRGYVRAAFTDTRVVVKIPQLLGSDERSVPYENILSVDLDTGLVKKRITLQTAGPTYNIEADEPEKDEIREAVNFARERMGGNSTTTEDDALDKLEKLRKLHEDGVLSDAEFEEKRRSLVDDI